MQREAHHWLQDHVQSLLILESMDEPVDSLAFPLGKVPQRLLLIDNMLDTLAILHTTLLNRLNTLLLTLHTTNLLSCLPRYICVLPA